MLCFVELWFKSCVIFVKFVLIEVLQIDFSSQVNYTPLPLPLGSIKSLAN